MSTSTSEPTGARLWRRGTRVILTTGGGVGLVLGHKGDLYLVHWGTHDGRDAMSWKSRHELLEVDEFDRLRAQAATGPRIPAEPAPEFGTDDGWHGVDLREDRCAHGRPAGVPCPDCAEL